MISSKTTWLKRSLAVFMMFVMTISLALTNSDMTVKADSNILSNADFSNGLNSWTTYVGSDWAGSAANFTALSGSGVQIDISSVGNSEWGIQMYQDGISYTSGTSYVLTFNIVSTMTKTVNTYIQNTDASGNWLADLGSQSVTLYSGSSQTVSITTSTLSNLTNLRLVMSFGYNADSDQTGTITITNMQMVPVSSSSGSTDSDEYGLVWSDEFEGTSLNTSNWVAEIGNGDSGWGNNEWEYYTDRTENLSVSDGALKITAIKESYNGYNYTSARIKTQGLQSFTYGKIEARIAMPSGTGLWPAFWMLGDSITSVGWPACGEIDIMEHINDETTVYGTVHWDSNGHAEYGGNITNIDVTQYHVYSIEWTETAIIWYVDGVQFHVIDITNSTGGTEEFHSPHFILLNLAVCGNWPGFTCDDSNLPATMSVDYVRVYQKGASSTVTTTEAATEATTEATTAAPTYPDMIVTGISWTPASPETGDEVVFSATVKNQGEGVADAGIINGLQFQIDGTCVSWSDDNSQQIQPGETVTLTACSGPNGTAVWEAEEGTHTVTAWINDINRYTESNTDNNTYSTTITVNAPVVETEATTEEPTTEEPTTEEPTTEEPTTEATTAAPETTKAPETEAVTEDAGTCQTVHIEAEDFSSQSGIEIASKMYENSQFINSISHGDTVTYDVELSGTGNYTIGVRASTTYTGYRAIAVYIDDVYVTTIVVENTGAWSTFNTFLSEELYLEKGSHTVTLMAVGGGYNINWIEFIADESETESGDDKDVTIHIEAEDYDSMSGVELRGTYDQGTDVLKSVDAGDYMVYTVDVEIAGIYRFDTRAARADAGTSVLSIMENGQVLGTVDVASTGGWSTFAEFEGTEFYLTAGTHTFTVYADGGRYNLNWFELVHEVEDSETTTEATTETETAAPVTSDSIHIEAEDYDSMSGVALRGTYDQGTDVLSSVDAGDYMVYTVDVATSGTYRFDVRAARADSGISVLSLMEDGEVIATVDIASTGGWGTFAEFEGTEVYLSAGTHTFTVYADGGRYNLNWFELTGTGAEEDTTEAETPITGESVHIEAEDYDSMSGVALRGTYDQGTDVLSSVDAGDYMIYTVEIPASGTYRFDVRAARNDAGSSLLSLMENDSVIATVSIAQTGGWGTFAEFTGTEVHLTAGTHTFKVYADGGRYNLNWYELTCISLDEVQESTEAETEESTEAETEESTEADTEEPTAESTTEAVTEEETGKDNDIEFGEPEAYETWVGEDNTIDFLG